MLGVGWQCEAFAKVPVAILVKQHDHRRPYEGDGGLQFVHKDLSVAIATDPPTSESQRRLMWAAASGHGHSGVPQSVAKEFTESDPGGKLPARAKDMAKSKWSVLKRLFVEWMNEEEAEPEHQVEDADQPRDQDGKFASAGAHHEQAQWHSIQANEHRRLAGGKSYGAHESARGAHQTAAGLHARASQHFGTESYRTGGKGKGGREIPGWLQNATEATTYAKKISSQAHEREPQGTKAPPQRDAVLPNRAASAASVAFVTRDGKVLFVKRGDREDNFPSHWALPGGKVDGDESEEECARREAKEELGDCNMDGMRAIDRAKSPRSGWDHTTFAVPAKDEFTPKLNGEHSEHRWCHVDTPPTPLHPGVKDTLDRVLKVGASTKDVADPTGKLSATTREQIGSTEHREDMPDSMFLLPERKKYPIGEKRDGELKHTRDLLLAAARRARMEGRGDLARKADAIRAREFGEGSSEDRPRALDWAIPRKPVRSLAMDRAIAFDVAMNRGLAFDKEAGKYTDDDGRLHVNDAVISKAVVNEYTGDEINQVMHGEPGWRMLEPERHYAMLRDPEELKKSVDTWDGLPLLWNHEPTSAKDHPAALTIGATGTNAKFEGDDLKNDLVIWPQHAIKAVDNGERHEISCGYAYRADMTPGTYKGQHYDGVMRDIKGNHVAMVSRGRVGAAAAIDHALPDDIARQRAWFTKRRVA